MYLLLIVIGYKVLKALIYSICIYTLCVHCVYMFLAMSKGQLFFHKKKEIVANLDIHMLFYVSVEL